MDLIVYYRASSSPNLGGFAAVLSNFVKQAAATLCLQLGHTPCSLRSICF